MLSAADNETLTRVGTGTPMGELLRRYWQPVAAVAQLDEQPTLAVRLMGEDLVLYKDTRGGYGLLDRHCPHRRADLCYGVPEQRGLRCHYHGWLFDSAGACLQQPFEEIARPEARFRDKIRTTAYPVQVKAGLLWAYLGPAPAPLVPDWDLFGERGYKQIVFSEIPCNWFQGQENSIDPIHFEWLHSNWSAALRGEPGAREPRQEPGLRRVGRPGRDRRPREAAAGGERSRGDPAAQAHARGGGRGRQGRRSEGRHPRSVEERLAATAARAHGPGCAGGAARQAAADAVSRGPAAQDRRGDRSHLGRAESIGPRTAAMTELRYRAPLLALFEELGRAFPASANATRPQSSRDGSRPGYSR